jgi:NAD-dependent protein deacetylase/lipoamidase
LERRAPRFALVTQNVDGLHRLAGSENVIELHGNIMRTVCSAEKVIVDDYAPEASPPVCPNCGATLRPDVVWFGEALPEDTLAAASEAARSCDLFLSVGTSSLVYPAAGLPLEASTGGAVLVEANPEETPISRRADFVLRGRAGEVLPALVEAVYG